jgi:[ribosomal protein S18]-alanine N-acetyltransferase
MQLQMGTLTEDRLRELCGWQYEPPYHIYQWGPYEELHKKDEPIADRVKREQLFVVVLSEDGQLVGFIEFQEREAARLLGLGLQPAITGQGIGKGLATSPSKKRSAVFRINGCAGS